MAKDNITAHFKKVDREFCLTDETVNVYGYRCLTSGLLLDEYKRNPIGFHMHFRDGGVVVRWEDLRIDGDKLYGKPVINLAHKKGERILSEVENNFTNAASVGHITVLEISDDLDDKVEGQTGPTITKWFPREISLCDIPGNFNALANLYDANGNELNLADLSANFNTSHMSKLVIPVLTLAALGLSDNATQTDVDKSYGDLLANAAKVPGLEANLNAMTIERDNLKRENETLKKGDVAQKVADLIATGKAEKRLTNEMAEKLAADYAQNPEGLKSLIATLPVQSSVVDTLTNQEKDLAAYDGKSWDDLYAAGQLETVRQKHPDLYARLRSEKYPNLKTT